ncbi:hypothetical protein R3W88_024358 [Solanum pinnatisectum]|uniref:Uncharacterized protein n=1 Tax=Solanum pinnatisectum TaxID=50273 RepID=A0AAV9M345_9SOLN|nr:hypothetical protein R3W88_024358 [Solanum pinnatisectum]
MDTCSFHTNHRWLEKDLWETEPLSINGNNFGGDAPGSFNLLLIVKRHMGKFFLDVISQEAEGR